MNTTTTSRLLKDSKYALFRTLFIKESTHKNKFFELQMQKMIDNSVVVPLLPDTELPHKDMDEQEYKKYFTRYAAKENWLCLGNTIMAVYKNRTEER